MRLFATPAVVSDHPAHAPRPPWRGRTQDPEAPSATIPPARPSGPAPPSTAGAMLRRRPPPRGGPGEALTKPRRGRRKAMKGTEGDGGERAHRRRSNRRAAGHTLQASRKDSTGPSWGRGTSCSTSAPTAATAIAAIRAIGAAVVALEPTPGLHRVLRPPPRPGGPGVDALEGPPGRTGHGAARSSETTAASQPPTLSERLRGAAPASARGVGGQVWDRGGGELVAPRGARRAPPRQPRLREGGRRGVRGGSALRPL